jgi:hypothetical protein
MESQPNFPKFSKNYAHLFLHACYWDVAASKKAITCYVDMRSTNNEYFQNRDPLLPNLSGAYDALLETINIRRVYNF